VSWPRKGTKEDFSQRGLDWNPPFFITLAGYDAAFYRCSVLLPANAAGASNGALG